MADEKPAFGKPFTKGVSGNPGGRTKAHRELARYIREKTDDGKKLADYCLAIAAKEANDDRVRMLAIEWLGDRGIGKPVQALELRDSTQQVEEAAIDWTKVPIERRQALLDAFALLDEMAPKDDDEADAPAEH